jgi:hypothetical protein
MNSITNLIMILKKLNVNQGAKFNGCAEKVA